MDNVDKSRNKFNQGIIEKNCLYDDESYKNVDLSETYYKVNERKVEYVETDDNVSEDAK